MATATCYRLANPFCRVSEGVVSLEGSRALPFEVRSNSWLEHPQVELKISAFDLAEDPKRIDFIRSALSGHVLVKGELIDLAKSEKA